MFVKIESLRDSAGQSYRIKTRKKTPLFFVRQIRMWRTNEKCDFGTFDLGLDIIQTVVTVRK